MKDPVTGIEYPLEWVRRCGKGGDLEMVRKGLAVLTSDGSILLRGFTTGTSAAAACSAAILSGAGISLKEVDVLLPCGIEVSVPVRAARGLATCSKFPGDYPDDATANIEFMASLIEFGDDLLLRVGEGIGRWDRDTPRFKKGEPAISSSARECIMNAMRRACGKVGKEGAEVHLRAVNGEAIARGTLNGKVGVIGGISVLGSTGLVEPWDDHLGKDVMERVRVAPNVVVTTGRIGLAHARRRYPDREVVLIGARIEEALNARCEDITLFGLPALIIHWLFPDILVGTVHRTVEELVLSPEGKEVIGSSLAEFKRRYPRARAVLIDRSGNELGATK